MVDVFKLIYLTFDCLYLKTNTIILNSVKPK